MLQNKVCSKADLDSDDMMKRWQVSDICFGSSSMQNIQHLVKMAEYRNTYLLNKNIRLPKCKTEREELKIEKILTKLESKFRKETVKFNDIEN